MAISFYDVDTFAATERRSSTVEALKARKAIVKRSVKRTVERVYLRTIFTECGVLMLGALAAAFFS